MLFEFDADQRLLRETAREVTAKQVPPTLIRDIIDKDLEPGSLWQTYVDIGWTELTDPAPSVELAIVLEQLGCATDPTPFLASMSHSSRMRGGSRVRARRSIPASSPGLTAADGVWTAPPTTFSTVTGRSVSPRSPMPVCSSCLPRR